MRDIVHFLCAIFVFLGVVAGTNVCKCPRQDYPLSSENTDEVVLSSPSDYAQCTTPSSCVYFININGNSDAVLDLHIELLRLKPEDRLLIYDGPSYSYPLVNSGVYNQGDKYRSSGRTLTVKLQRRQPIRNMTAINPVSNNELGFQLRLQSSSVINDFELLVQQVPTWVIWAALLASVYITGNIFSIILFAHLRSDHIRAQKKGKRSYVSADWASNGCMWATLLGFTTMPGTPAVIFALAVLQRRKRKSLKKARQVTRAKTESGSEPTEDRSRNNLTNIEFNGKLTTVPNAPEADGEAQKTIQTASLYPQPDNRPAYIPHHLSTQNHTDVQQQMNSVPMVHYVVPYQTPVSPAQLHQVSPISSVPTKTE